MFQEKRHAIDLKLLDLKEAIKFEIRNLTILNLNQKLILQGWGGSGRGYFRGSAWHFGLRPAGKQQLSDQIRIALFKYSNKETAIKVLQLFDTIGTAGKQQLSE